MNNNIDKEDIMILYDRIMDKLDELKRELKRISETRSVIEGELMISTRDLCQMLGGVTERTLFRYRKQGLLSGVTIARKVFYRATEVRKLMKYIDKLNNKTIR